jgi:hypothetical protein
MVQILSMSKDKKDLAQLRRIWWEASSVSQVALVLGERQGVERT